jgi:hypothetical protein
LILVQLSSVGCTDIFQVHTKLVLFIVFNVWCSVITVHRSTTQLVHLLAPFIFIQVIVPTLEVYQLGLELE